MKPVSNVLRVVALTLLVVGLVACAARQEKGEPSMMSDADIVTELAGKVWVAEYIHGQPVIDMSHTSMVFTTDGKVSGSGGCNSFSGTYTLKDGMISFPPMATTMKMCAEALSDQEMRFFQSLGGEQKVSFENDLLQLIPDGGKPSVFAVHETE